MTVTTAVAARVLEALGEAYRRQAGPVLEDLVDGIAAPINDADSRLTETDSGWAAAFDLNLTPDPAWTGRAIGSKVPGGLTVEQARTYIRERPYWRRGTPAAIRAAVGALLAGSKTVTLLERDGSPWRLRVRVYEPEVPAGVTLAQLHAAAVSQKPVGIVLTTEIAPTASYAHFAAEHGPSYDDAATEFPTYESARFHVPEEGTV